MRVKHFAGYGCVEAKKIDKYVDEDGYTVTRVRVIGDHEWGLCPYIMTDAIKWLLPRFDKAVKDGLEVAVGYEWLWGLPTDGIDYIFKYKIER